MPTVHLIIKGKVQGVFYRASAREQADHIGVTGWIRNTEAGGVEAVASGTAEQVQDFISWCRQGPSRAVVTEVETTTIADASFDGFTIKRG